MRFGVTAPANTDFEGLVKFWQEAEAAGYDSAFVFDHFMGAAPGPPGMEACLESWTTLSALAAKTARMKVGVLVTGNTYRHPAVVAKMAATVDHVSRGRLILGLGAAWLEREHTAYGIPFYTPGLRARRLGEAVEVIKKLFVEDRANFTGTAYTLKDAPCEPKPLQKPHPPILIGGKGEKVLQPIAAKHAQIWHFMVPGAEPEAVKALCEGFDRICAQVGRNPAEVERATSVDPALFNTIGKDMIERLRALRAVGVGHVVFLPPPNGDRSLLREIATDVLPALRT